MNNKPPLPRISLDKIMPTHNADLKCAPTLSFNNGSCIPLNILIDMTHAYNNYCKNNNIDKIINTEYNNIETDQDAYKRYLLHELQNRIGNKLNQHEWNKHDFMNFLNNEIKKDLTNNIFRPTGPQGKFDWLSTFDINYTLEQYENKYNDFKFLESTVPYTDFIGLNRFNFTLFPFFIKFHITKVYLFVKK